MKNYTSVIFLFAAVIIATLLFAFKAEEPKEEYATIQYFENYKKDAIIVNVNSEMKVIATESYNDEKKFLETLNGLASEGWVVSSTNCVSTGAFTKRVVYLERRKQ